MASKKARRKNVASSHKGEGGMPSSRNFLAASVSMKLLSVQPARSTLVGVGRDDGRDFGLPLEADHDVRLALADDRRDAPLA